MTSSRFRPRHDITSSRFRPRSTWSRSRSSYSLTVSGDLHYVTSVTWCYITWLNMTSVTSLDMTWLDITSVTSHDKTWHDLSHFTWYYMTWHNLSHFTSHFTHSFPHFPLRFLPSLATPTSLSNLFALPPLRFPPYLPTLWPLPTPCRHVKRISYEVDVDINLVKICLQNLLQFGYILIIPIFLYRLGT